jgi:DNA-binding SARP family transcriptional activator
VRSSRDTFTLVTLGRLTLLAPNVDVSETMSKRRLKLAMLAVLATAKRPLSRSTLAEMFWGDQDESRARHSLSDALSHLRRELGRRAIASQTGDVCLDSDAPLVIDAAMFVEAVETRDFARAASLYAGPFLDGVEIEAGPSFEQWVTRERRHLEAAFFQVCAQQCLAHARAREWDQCGALAARWLDAAPLSVDAALFRLNAIKAPGTREAAQRALDEFDELTARLARDFDLAPEKPVRQLADNIRENIDSLAPEPAAITVVSVAATDDGAVPVPATSAPAPVAPNEIPRPENCQRATMVVRRPPPKLSRHINILATLGVAVK